MLCVIVDHNWNECERIAELFRTATHEKFLIKYFMRTDAAFLYISKNPVDIVFCEQNPPYCDGFKLGEMIRSLNADTAFVLMSDSEKYAIDAFSVNARGYLVKPVTREKIAEIAGRLKALKKPEESRHIKVRTFGFFDLYVNGEVVIFANRRAKELLAILVDHRGGMVPMERIIDAFWPEEPENERNKAVFRKALMDLKNTLKRYGVEYILISQRGQKAVVASYLDCDYYKALDGDMRALSGYFGEYMAEYSWAEDTNARIYTITEKAKAVM